LHRNADRTDPFCLLTLLSFVCLAIPLLLCILIDPFADLGDSGETGGEQQGYIRTSLVYDHLSLFYPFSSSSQLINSSYNPRASASSEPELNSKTKTKKIRGGP